MKKESFARTVFQIALPVTLQSLLQFSFSVVDQVMIGQLGSYSIAGIGLGESLCPFTLWCLPPLHRRRAL